MKPNKDQPNTVKRREFFERRARDLVDEMELAARSPWVLFKDLERMGVTEDGDEPEDDVFR